MTTLKIRSTKPVIFDELFLIFYSFLNLYEITSRSLDQTAVRDIYNFPWPYFCFCSFHLTFQSKIRSNTFWTAYVIIFYFWWKKETNDIIIKVYFILVISKTWKGYSTHESSLKLSINTDLSIIYFPILFIRKLRIIFGDIFYNYHNFYVNNSHQIVWHGKKTSRRIISKMWTFRAQILVPMAAQPRSNVTEHSIKKYEKKDLKESKYFSCA